MCRWVAYSGSPVSLADLLYGSEHSLVVQSLHAKLGNEETNGDGFGVGWYDDEEAPAVFRGIEPAWNDRNLRDLSGHVRSGLVFAHVRASTHAPVQLSNCHPFRHGRWLFMHNGLIHDFVHLKRDLTFEVDPGLYPEIEGSTDSEVFFYLALTLGLEVSDHMLTITGAHEQTAEEIDKTFRLHERIGGAFERTFMLPPEIDGERVTATFEKGLLKVHAPKAEAARPRKIAISKP